MFNALGVLLITTLMSLPFPGRPWRILRIGLYYNTPVGQVVFTPVRGKYEIIGNGKRLGSLQSGDLLYVSFLDTAIIIMQEKGQWQSLDSVKLVTNKTSSRFRLQPLGRDLDARIYPGHCIFATGAGGLLMINEVPENDYLAGVLLAEGGSSSPQEYYKVQAILSRTFLVANPGRHAGESFQVCDEAHCQAYHGLATDNRVITRAIKKTRDVIVTDPENQPIQPAYHSNSGGETATAEKVWLGKIPYLITHNDPYSEKGPHYRWKKEIPLKEWLSWLKKQGLNVSVPIRQLAAIQNHRTYIYHAGNLSIPYHKIREDWHLPSAFFSIVVVGDFIILNGRGYGHGLGLSQEGAMEMARQGYSAKQIIRFYYPGVTLNKWRDH